MKKKFQIRRKIDFGPCKIFHSLARKKITTIFRLFPACGNGVPPDKRMSRAPFFFCSICLVPAPPCIAFNQKNRLKRNFSGHFEALQSQIMPHPRNRQNQPLFQTATTVQRKQTTTHLPNTKQRTKTQKRRQKKSAVKKKHDQGLGKRQKRPVCFGRAECALSSQIVRKS